MNTKSRLTILLLVVLCNFFYLSGQTNPFENSTDSVFIDNMKVLLWADFNNDGFKDALVFGAITEVHIYSIGYDSINQVELMDTMYIYHPSGIHIYQNLGDSDFELRDDFFIKTSSNPIVNTGDFNNNGYLDIIVSINEKYDDNPDYNTYIFKNTGDWDFEELLLESVPGQTQGVISIVDFNNDGRKDFLFCGQNEAGEVSSRLYKNRGNFQFTYIPTSIKGVRNGLAEWADYNKNGFSDLLISGQHVTERRELSNFVAIYENNRDGTFTRNADFSYDGYGLARWGDYDNDGFLDILITGMDGYRAIKLYKNDGDANFNEVTNFNHQGYGYSTILWEDLNNNGYLDIFYSGRIWDAEEYLWFPGSSLLIYDGEYEEIEISIDNLSELSSSIADPNNNGVLDVFYFGRDEQYSLVSKILINESVPNTPPSVPEGLNTYQQGNTVVLTWDKSTDAQTFQDALTYDIRISTSPGGYDILSPVSLQEDGKRLKYKLGRTSWIEDGYVITNLLPGDYYWTVQAIDVGYMASDFAEEQSFTIELTPAVPEPPTYLNAKIITENIVDISWAYQYVDAAEFIIERSEVNNDNFEALDTVKNNIYYYRDDELIPETQYFYRIITLLDEEKSSYSDTLEVHMPAKTLFSKVLVSELTKDDYNSTGAAWGDFNNNGLLDLCVVNRSAPIQLFKNIGDGNFEEIIIELSELVGEFAHNPYGNPMSVTWVDINNNGYLDLFITHGWPYINVLLLNNQDETFTQVTNSTLTEDMGQAYSVAWSDYDKDGLVDVFISIYDDKNRLYRNVGDLQFELIDLGETDDDPKNSLGCIWIDYNNNRHMDLFVANYYEENYLYKNNGDGTFSRITSGAIVTDQEPTVAGTWGDFTNNGFVDLLALNNVNQDNSLYENMGDGTFSKTTVWPFANRNGILGAGVGAAWEDMNNNGNLDLFIANGYDNKLFMNNGDGTFTEVTNEPFCIDYGSSFAALWTDYDNDGNVDLFIPNGSNQANFLYRNNGAFEETSKKKSANLQNNRVMIRLKGVESNSYGLGAKVEVTSESKTISRYITTQSGAVNSINNLIASVGIGANTDVSVKIFWPSGIYQEVSLVDINTLVIIEEDGEMIDPPGSGEQEPGSVDQEPGSVDEGDIETTIDNSSLKVNIYPNPAKSELYVEFVNDDDYESMYIADIAGAVVKHVDINNYSYNRIVVDINKLQSGTYLLVIKGKNSKKVKIFNKIH